MAGSIHVAVRKAIVDGLEGAFASESDVSVTYGWQGSDDTRSRVQVFTSNARGDHSSAAMNGPNRNPRNESMQFDITVLVEGVGLKPEDAEQRAIDLGVVVEEFIADHKSNQLGIVGLNWIEMVSVASDYRIAPGAGSLGILTYTVHYQARLT